MQTPCELRPMTAVIRGLRFETRRAVLLAFTPNDSFAGQKFLFKTAGDRYFVQTQGEHASLRTTVKAVSTRAALNFWNTCEDSRKIHFGSAFPALRRRVRAA